MSPLRMGHMFCFQIIKQACDNDVTFFHLDERKCFQYLPELAEKYREKLTRANHANSKGIFKRRFFERVIAAGFALVARFHINLQQDGRFPRLVLT